MELTRYRPSVHAHEFTPGGNSRVVMIRKKEQRTFAVGQTEKKFETLTKETVQTFRGNKIERKITSEKRDFNSEIFKQISLLSLDGTVDSGKGKSTESIASVGQINGEKKKPEIVKKKKDSSVSFVTQDEFAQECLEAHNEKRALHKSPPLRLSKKLCRYSEEWARHLAARGEMVHRSESEYGENLFLIWSSGSSAARISGSEPVEHWYSEISSHVFHKEPTSLKTGHFTQVVWTESEELGVGMATSKSGQVYVVCNYNPPGNFIGAFADNVPPLGGFTHPPKSRLELKNDDEFQKEMVKIHNEYRTRHGSPPLQLSKELSSQAQEWALHCAREDKIESKPGCPYGENILGMWGPGVCSAKDACASWYSGVRHFQYGVEPRALVAGHFTQMVWRSTKEIGIGRAKSKLGQVIIVAFYRPAGNQPGQFMANVSRP